MLPNKLNSINIFGVKISKLDEETFLEYIGASINRGEKRTIAYANADTLNKIYDSPDLSDIYCSFDIIHPDGIGVYLASGFLFPDNGLEKRFNGSDFYDTLIKGSVENNWSIFFFGHKTDILGEISKTHPRLNIAGVQEGYNYTDKEVVEKINASNPDILIVGLSCPIQEKWMFENVHRINCRIILAVGDGIRIFAGKKIRGPMFMRKLGLEWAVRYIQSPVSNFRRYITGIPLFIFRIFKEKKEKLKTN